MQNAREGKGGKGEFPPLLIMQMPPSCMCKREGRILKRGNFLPFLFHCVGERESSREKRGALAKEERKRERKGISQILKRLLHAELRYKDTYVRTAQAPTKNLFLCPLSANQFGFFLYSCGIRTNRMH